MQYVIGLLILCVIVFFHELGHFLAAKACGVCVEEFSIGMGPKLIRIQSRKSGTKYSIRLFPIGGFCALKGEDSSNQNSDQESDQNQDSHEEQLSNQNSDKSSDQSFKQKNQSSNQHAEQSSEHNKHDVHNVQQTHDESDMSDSFANASVFRRMIIIAAGPVFNLILAFVVAVVLIAICGQAKPVVTYVNDEIVSSGLQVGDKIVSYNGHSVSTSGELYLEEYCAKYEDSDEVVLTVLRDGEKLQIAYPVIEIQKYGFGATMGTDESGNLVILQFLDDSAAEEAGLQTGDVVTSINGVTPTEDMNLSEYLDLSPLTEEEITITYKRDGETAELTFVPGMISTTESGFSYSTTDMPSSNVLVDTLCEMKYSVKSIVKSLGMLITGKFGFSDLSGPVGIVETIGNGYEAAVTNTESMAGVGSLLTLIVLISVNLGVFNLIPIPALDGGRLFFLIIEAIRRKPLRDGLEPMIHQIGFSLLMLLSLAVIIQDLIRLMWSM